MNKVFKIVSSAILRRWLSLYFGKPVDWKQVLKFVRDGCGGDNVFEDSLRMDAALYEWISIEAGQIKEGSHPKHRYLNYFQWFSSHLEEADTVLDIGCGHGQMTLYMAENTSAKVLGVELEKEKIDFCQKTHLKENLTFLHGDITEMSLADLSQTDVVTLSNVLEHIEDRQALLSAVTSLSPRLLLIRVPQYDRDWRVPVKNECGIDYRLDKTHVLEYTEEAFDKEMMDARIEVISKKFNWGEIWAVCRPIR